MHEGFITNAAPDLRTGDDQESTVDQGHDPELWLRKVGVRDHSHGNRVSVTDGDKVEIVTGNYKLIVLGGDKGGTTSTGFDMSGGHTVNWAQTPGCIKRIEARKDGGWRVTHSTENAEEINIFEGKLYEHHVGGEEHYVCSFMGMKHPDLPDGRGKLGLVRDSAYAKKIHRRRSGRTHP